MPPVRIVTDSSAHFFDPDFPALHHVSVVPMHLRLGAQAHREGVDLTPEAFFQTCSPTGPAPKLIAPTPEEYAQVYESLSLHTGHILSIHTSGKLSRAPQNARAGTNQVLGRCKIQVIDSLSISIGLGVLVQEAALAAEAGASLPELVRLVRGMIPRLYSVFFVDNMDYLAQAGRLSKAQAILGAMLGIKPFLTFDDGDLVPMEKVRHRAQAIEKLVEFVVEFTDIQHLGILQGATHLAPQLADDTRQLLERLAIDFPGRTWPVLTYAPSLGTFLGPNALGVIVLESEAALETLSAFHSDQDDEI